MTPLHQNSQTSLGPWEWAFSRPGTCRRGPWSQLTYPTIRLFCWANPENFSLFHAVDQKLFHFYRQTDTDRQTHRRTFCIPICTGEIFFYMEIYTFHNTTWVSELRSLTHFVCEGLTIPSFTKVEPFLKKMLFSWYWNAPSFTNWCHCDYNWNFNCFYLKLKTILDI